MAKKLKIALIFGGRSAEHEVSLNSAAAIFKNIDIAKYTPVSIYITKRGDWKFVRSPLLPLEELARGAAYSFLPWKTKGLDLRLAADVYFPVLHGPFGEDGTIQGLLEMADVPYVGAAVLASAVGMDKATMKAVFLARGLPVVKHRVLAEAEWKENGGAVLASLKKEFSLPLFVKPSNLGSSVGVTKVKNGRRIRDAVETAFRYDRKILVEQGIEGGEFECSVLGNDRPRASLPAEIIPFREFYDYRDKYLEGKTTFVIPARLPPARVMEIQRISMDAFKAIDCSGMARVDFLWENSTRKLYLNEINTIPGFTEISMYPRLWEASGIPFPELVSRLIELGLERHRARKICLRRFPS